MLSFSLWATIAFDSSIATVVMPTRIGRQHAVTSTAKRPTPGL
jgi:hypothetical protein